ncbi:MAG: imidazole glycerol phosphate synthase cyclase subunit [Oscillospiraceae bacterium]|nr:imidazole glycerol phosphate synthase cyclase subunit [Oscillospiraceae bacterium]
MGWDVRRIIAGIDVKDGRVVKGVRFADPRDAGDPVEAAALYSREGADEICLLDIAASVEGRKTFAALVSEVKKAIETPLSVSGGIKSVADVGDVLAAGADAVGIGSAAVRAPGLVRDAAREYGGSKITIAMDVKRQRSGAYTVMVDMGRTDTGLDALEAAKRLEADGAGSVLLTSFDADGVMGGYDVPLCKAFAEALAIPVVASGGAGSMGHFLEVLTGSDVEAAFAASVFHFGTVRIPELKRFLRDRGVGVRI